MAIPKHYAPQYVQDLYEAGAPIRVLAELTGHQAGRIRRGLINTGVQLRPRGQHGHTGVSLAMVTEMLANRMAK